jgi:hypothetical protein
MYGKVTVIDEQKMKTVDARSTYLTVCNNKIITFDYEFIHDCNGHALVRYKIQYFG